MVVERTFETRGESAADDLLDATLLTWAGRDRGFSKGAFGFFLQQATGCDKPAEGVRSPIERVREPGPFGHLSAALHGRQDGNDELAPVLASRRQDGLSGPRRHRSGSGDVGSGQMTGPLKFLRQPKREGRRLADVSHGLVQPVLRSGTGGDDVAPVCSDVHLPGKSSAGTGTDRRLPPPVVHSPVPDMEAA